MIIAIVVFCIITIFLSCFAIWLKQPETIGKIGERAVFKILRKDKNGYVINNLIIEDENGKTCQIDHVYISSSGVYVIETKNYAGMLFGRENDNEWLQVLNYGKVKNKLYNPVKQNNTHVYRVKQVLNNNAFVFSLIVILRADISNVHAENVIRKNQLKSFISQKRELLLPEEQKRIYEMLCRIKENQVSDGKHVENVIKMRKDIENGICPRCKGELVVRNGKYGKFLGCSNYPKCKFKKQL